MTGQALLNLLMVRLGNRTDATLRANCLTELNLAQETMLEGGSWLPWFLLSSEQTLSVSAGNAEVSLPTGFLRFSDEHPLYILDDENKRHRLTQWDRSYLESKYEIDDASDLPLEFCLERDKIYLFPTPTVARSIKMKCYLRDTVLTDTTQSNNWSTEAPDWLLAVTGEVVALQHLSDQELAAGFVAMQQRALQRVQTMDIARREAGRSRSKG
jgi:hypothetical protein